MLEVIPPLFIWSFLILFYSCQQSIAYMCHNLFNQFCIESLVKNEENLQPSVISHSPSSTSPRPSSLCTQTPQIHCSACSAVSWSLLTSLSTEVALVLVTKFNDYFLDFIELEFSGAMLITCPLLLPNTVHTHGFLSSRLYPFWSFLSLPLLFEVL